MKSPKVSVIVPTYKRPETLSRAINSILNQTYQNIEIIIVDDNNPSDEYRKKTEKVMKKYESNEKVIYIKHTENRNGSAARNTGIKNSHAEYIAFLDDDDEFLPNKIEVQVQKMMSLDESWGACYTSYKKIMSNGKIQHCGEKREGDLLLEALMRTLYIYGGSNLMVRKSVVDELKGFDESFKRNQDIEFLVRILKSYKLAYVDTCSLIIHYDCRVIKMTYEQLQEVDKLYKQSFDKFINELPSNEQEKVYSMIALDNFKESILNKSLEKGIKELIKSKIPFFVLVRYIIYVFKRMLTNKCYGFEL